MTTTLHINRRTWLALWAQDRRRRRVRAAQAPLLPAPVLRAAYPDLLQWDWELADPDKWAVWMSLDEGGTWTLLEDYWTGGDGREFAPDGGSELYFIVGVDANGREITQRSNSVRPDDADPDAGDLVAITMVPQAVVQATCELARELIIADRTAAPPGEGLSFQNVGSTQTGYNKADTRPIIPAVVQALLAKFGVLIKAKSGTTKLVRA